MKMKKGFTIIELIIYIGLLAGFITILGQLFFSILDTQLISQANSAVDAEGQFLVTRLSYDIRRAASLSAPAVLGDSGSVMTIDIDGVSYTYTVSGTNLVLTTGGNSQPLNSETVSVSGFNVTRMGNPDPAPASVLIDFSINSNIVSLHQTAQTRSYQITVNLQ